MAGFDVISEHGIAPKMAGEVISTSPDWVLVVVRFAHPMTYSRGVGGSFSNLYQDAVKTRGKPLIIRDHCLHLTTNATKGSHLATLNAILLPDPALNWTSELLPGDWLLAWAANDSETIDSVVERVRAGKAANGFRDGLKFVGKVGSCRKSTTIDPVYGTKQSRYTLSGTAFSEFDSTLFYDPHLAEKIPAVGQYWARLGAALDELVAKGGLGLDVNSMIPFFLDLLLGRGVKRNLGLPDIAALQNTAGLEAAHSYVVPTEIGAMLDKTKVSKPGGILCAADLIELVYGVQSYENIDRDLSLLDLPQAGDPEDLADSPLGLLFNPTRTQYANSRRFTGTKMMGTFLPSPPQFTGKSVWSVMSQYLNPACNEMYVCLRTNARGQVVPTLVLRQLPFSTPFAPEAVDGTRLDTTKFLDLPRWKLHPHLVTQENLGRSDSLRLNFCHVYGDIGPVKNNMYNGQVVRYPPKRDDLDIARNGLRNYSTTVPCHEKDVRLGGPAKWMALLADFLMGQHLALTGLAETVGITSPICPGDNVEYDEAVYHIESVGHTCSIDVMGRKKFRTNLTLSHGMAANPDPGLLGIYAGLTAEDQRGQEPEATTDIPDNNPGETTPGFRFDKALESGEQKLKARVELLLDDSF